ncbi:nucleotidyltransferase family protein [Prevotella communis]|nr:nucleotidyltransferase family protein [Prevotella communis]
MWRPSGDVDLLLSDANYKKAKDYLLPLSSGNKHDERYSKHMGMNISQWYVEIHGSLRTGLSARVDKEVDAAQDSVFIGGNVRSWDNNGTLVFLLAPTEDVFLVFTHFIKHFYKEGMSLRQVCDWCRLLWTYRDSLNYGKLELWINKAGLMKEWKTFYNLASRYLGMPDLDSRLMVHDSRFDDKADRLMEFILGGYSGNKFKDTLHVSKIFPWKALRYSPSIFLNVNWLKIKERIFLVHG